MPPVFGGSHTLQPLWWGLSLGACVGGNGTLIGSSANLAAAGIAERNAVPLHFLRYTKLAFSVDPGSHRDRQRARHVALLLKLSCGSRAEGAAGSLFQIDMRWRTPSAAMLRPRPRCTTSPRSITRYWSASSAAKS